MGFVSAIGRALFVVVFLYSAWLQFHALTSGGGPAMEVFNTKFDLLNGLVHSKFGLELPKIEIKYVIATDIALKGIGSALFILGCSVGAYLLLFHLATAFPVLHSFEEAANNPELLLNIAKDLALCGALIVFLGMKSSIKKRQSKKKFAKSKTM